MARTVYHVTDGPTTMPYEVDATNALRHPEEWRDTPWSIDETNEYRRRQYDRQAAEAKDAGLPPPKQPVDLEIDPDQQEDIDQDRKNRDEAQKLVDDYDKEENERTERIRKVQEARMLLETKPPQPTPRPADQPAKGPVDIPATWRDLSPQQRRTLAIRLGAPNTIKAAEADDKIEAAAKARDGATSGARGNPAGPDVPTTPDPQPSLPPVGTGPGPMSPKASGKVDD